MPPVTGKFQADFSSFYEAVEKAQVHLKSFESDSSKVERSLNRMADGFSGRRVIQEATQMAEAIKETGGLSKLTGAELQRAGALADEAAEKMQKLGMNVPPGIERISKAAKEASPTLETLKGTASHFDGVLGALGININKQVKFLEDLTGASGKTATGLGLVATTGLAVGAGMAGWGVGRAIADFFALDEKIAGAAARLLGYGDVAEQVAGAKQDTINIAIANGAKATITYTEAIEFNKKAIQTASNTYVDWEQRLDNARARVQQLTEEEIRKIQIARQLGASQEQLAHDFKLSGDAVKALDELLEKQANNEKKLAEASKQLSETKLKNLEKERKAAEENAKKFSNLAEENLAIELSMTGTRQQAKAAAIEAEFQREVGKLNKLDKEYEKFYKELERQRDLKLERETANFDQINQVSRSSLQERADFEQKTLEVMMARSGEFSAAQIAQQRETWYAAKEAVHNFGLEAEATLTSVAEKAKEEADRITKFMTAATLNSRDAFSFSTDVPKLVGTALDQAIQQGRRAGDNGGDAQALNRLLAQLESKEGRYEPKNNREFFDMQREQLLLAQLRQLKGSGVIPGFRDGVTDFPGGLARVHQDELLVNLPKGTSVIPAGKSAGAGPTFVIQVNAGLGDRMTIAKAIKDVLVADFKSYGYRGPVPFGA
jgi:hypothetical protein